MGSTNVGIHQGGAYPSSANEQSGGGDEAGGGDRGRLGPVAARILMKVLWVARFARLDLLRVVGFLATKITKWTSKCDRQLYRLIGYMKGSASLRMVGWVGDSFDSISPHLYADADFAGCVESLRSTSGVHQALLGPNTNFPIAGHSKRQGCVSHSTPEAEMVAMDYAMRTTGLPAHSLWEALMPDGHRLTVHEDNQAMIACVRSGRNPTMRYLHRTHRVSVQWLHERFTSDDSLADLIYEDSIDMCADIYTKAFNEELKWVHACDLINIIHPKRLRDRFKHHVDYMGKDTTHGVTSTSTASPCLPGGGGTRVAQLHGVRVR